MKIAVMQPYVFPYLGYFQMVSASDCFVFYDNVDYKQRGFINRNQFLSNGSKQYFTVPVKKSSLGTKINEVEVVDYAQWKTKFFKQIQFSYSKAPFFEETFRFLNEFLNHKDYSYISELASDSVIALTKYFRLKRDFVLASQIPELNKFIDKIDKLEHIMDCLKASAIVLPPGSKMLYQNWHPKNGKKETLELPKIVYKQFGNTFVENLSIIDVLMFNEQKQVLSYIETLNYQ